MSSLFKLPIPDLYVRFVYIPHDRFFVTFQTDDDISPLFISLKYRLSNQKSILSDT